MLYYTTLQIQQHYVHHRTLRYTTLHDTNYITLRYATLHKTPTTPVPTTTATASATSSLLYTRVHATTWHVTIQQYTAVQVRYITLVTPHHNHNCNNGNYTTLVALHYNYTTLHCTTATTSTALHCTTLHPAAVGEGPLEPLQPFKKKRNSPKHLSAHQLVRSEGLPSMQNKNSALLVSYLVSYT